MPVPVLGCNFLQDRGSIFLSSASAVLRTRNTYNKWFRVNK
jgi:hypothetical protein